MYTNDYMRANLTGFNIKAACYLPQSPEEQSRGLSLLLPLEQREGFVFVLAHTKKENDDAQAFYQSLNEQVHRLAKTFGGDANSQHRFEQFLGTVNEALAQHVKEGSWNIPIQDVHCILGVTTGKEMYLTGNGDLTALFLHKKTENRFQVFNLFRGIQTEQALPTWEKLFAVVLDGELHAGDAFCLTNKNVQHTIDQDELNQILSTLPPTGSVEKIRQYFGHADHVQLITLRMIPDAEQVLQAPTTTPTNISVEKMVEVEEYTDTLLDDQRPSLRVFIQRGTDYVKQRIERSESRILKDLETQGTPWDITKRLFRNIIRASILLAKQLNRRVRHRIRYGNEDREHAHIAKAARQPESITTKERAAKVFASVASTPNATKYLAGGIFVAVIVLVVGVTSISRSQARAAAQAAYQDQLSTIEDVIDRAAGAVIYKDEDQARSLYVNAQTLIEQLPTETEEEQTTATDLKHQVEIALNELSNLITIPNPPLLADLSSISDGVFGSGLLETDEIYILGTDSNLYQYNPEQKNLTVSLASSSIFNAVATTSEDANLYALSEAGTLASINIASEAIQETAASNAAYVDIDAYGTRVYLLRKTTQESQGQIVRYNISGNDVSNETEWITSRSSELDQAVSLSIDGTIFVLMRNGNIIRFESGSEVGWEPGLVEPPITNATKIWTDAQSDYVYVLEPDTKRVIVFSKDNGSFVVQYRSDAFTNLQDMIIDEDGYTIYLLADTKLYSIAASHLE